jgi:uncharacterized membrane protein YfcA
MSLDMPLIAMSMAIIFIAYFIRGITGFGSGLIAVPLLAHTLPLTFVVPFVMVLDLTAALILGGYDKKHIRWDEVKPIIPATLIGVMLGVTLLTNLPREPLLTALGIFVIVFGLRSLLNIHGDRPVARGWAYPAGFSGGLIGALFNTGGPPYVIYYSHRIKDKTEFRATLSGIFLLDSTFRMLMFLVAGLLFQENLLIALLLALPVMGIGLFAGNRVHIGISPPHLLMLIGALLIGSGASLLWKAWL